MADQEKPQAPTKPSWIFSKGLLGDSKWRIPLLILIICLFLLILFIIGNSGNKQPNIIETQSQPSSSSQLNPYVGTYEFKGEYKYNQQKNCISGLLQNHPDEVVWIPATLTLRVTFEPVPYAQYPTSWDRFTVLITKLWVDDPDFGTGADGITPIMKEGSYKGAPGRLILPGLPRAADDPVSYAVIDGNRANDPLSSHGIQFDFPTGPEEEESLIGIWSLAKEGYYVSPDGKTFHSNPIAPNAFLITNTWKGGSQIGSGHLSYKYTINQGFCDTKFISWTFTKISD